MASGGRGSPAVDLLESPEPHDDPAENTRGEAQREPDTPPREIGQPARARPKQRIDRNAHPPSPEHLLGSKGLPGSIVDFDGSDGGTHAWKGFPARSRGGSSAEDVARPGGDLGQAVLGDSGDQSGIRDWQVAGSVQAN